MATLTMASDGTRSLESGSAVGATGGRVERPSGVYHDSVRTEGFLAASPRCGKSVTFERGEKGVEGDLRQASKGLGVWARLKALGQTWTYNSSAEPGAYDL